MEHLGALVPDERDIAYVGRRLQITIYQNKVLHDRNYTHSNVEKVWHVLSMSATPDRGAFSLQPTLIIC